MNIAVLDLSDDRERSIALEMAMRTYSNEPCRICGELVTYEDINTHNAVLPRLRRRSPRRVDQCAISPTASVIAVKGQPLNHVVIVVDLDHPCRATTANNGVA